MPRPNQGYSEVLYVRVKPINKKFVELRAARLQKKIPSASASMIIDKMIDRERKKAANKKEE